MKESWLEPIACEDIVKLVKKRCPRAENICVPCTSYPNGERTYSARYTLTFDGKEYNHTMEIGEVGEMLSLNPRGGEDFFKIARRKNAGRVINGETFEQFYKI